MVSSSGAVGGALPAFDDLWDYGDPAGTGERFRALLPAARQSGDAEYTAALLSQIARTEGLQRRFDEAHALLNEAEALCGEGAPLARARCLLERGRVCNSSGSPADSLPFFRAALDAFTALGEEAFAVDAAHMLGIAAPPAEALTWNERAIAMAAESQDSKARRWLGPLYNNTGWTHFDAGRHREALVLFEKALELYAAFGKEEPTRIARWTVARCLRALGQTAEALSLQQALLSEREAAGKPSGYVYEELGECLLELGRAGEARPHFRRASELLSAEDWLRESEPERLERLRTLGETT